MPDSIHPVPDHLQKFVEEFGAWGSFVDVMRRSLISEGTQETVNQSPEKFSWMELPDLCCQAAGGDPVSTSGVKAAWGMLYTAAHMMDTVVDGDNTEEWWASISPPAAINIATALYGGSGLILSELFNEGTSYDVAIDILGKFQHTILKMCAGQHLELSKRELSLNEYWRITEAKSGSFFGLACYAGARLATDDLNILKYFLDFGTHLGTIIQMNDDVKDIWPSKTDRNISLSNPFCLLPIIYALSVLSKEESAYLLNLLQDGEEYPKSMNKIRVQLEEIGAGLYLMTKAEQHRLMALQSLQRTNMNVAIYNKFENILSHLCFSG